MVNTPAAPRFRGGDLTQMRKTAEVLRALGVEVAESFEPLPDGRGCDLAHVFNLRTVDVTPGQVRHLRESGLPVVLSPIYLDPSLALWATRAIRNIFGAERDEEEVARLLGELRDRTLRIELAEGGIMTARSENRPRRDYDGLQRATLEQVDCLVPNSYLELHALHRTLGAAQLPFSVVPYAADPGLFLEPDPAPFVERYGLSDFVLQVGRIEASKNQLLLAYALREAGLPLVLVGGSFQPEYLEWCRRHGPPDLLVVPHLAPEELAAAYAAARVHALPSWIETCGLVTMEAALGGCSAVASTAGYELEYYRDLVRYCDPGDVESIRAAVLDAWERHDEEADRRERLRALVLAEYTWERAARVTLDAYRRVLESR
jgi:glycosyltransferase involved in cell wall biosynthesis